ncbi:Arsenate reductase [Vibrio owensii]|nr:Arsenate reductase [Vibrio owensii]CAH1548675.1 Arsenate reductase [Vibrio owensii]
MMNIGEGMNMDKVLFICKHNAGRSVIAESIATQLWSPAIKVASGGSHPVGSIDPVVKQFLEDHSMPVPHNYSHSWEERTAFQPDIVFILCDTLHQERAPMWLSGGTWINWQVDAFDNKTSDRDKYAHCQRLRDSLHCRLSIVGELLQSDIAKEELEIKLVELKGM